MVVYIVDASGLKIALKLFSPKDKFLTVRQVYDEMKTDDWREIAEIIGIEIDKIEKEHYERVKEKAYEVGISDFISDNDLRLCALALKHDGIVVTNDMYIQNLCYFLGIKFVGEKRIKYAKVFRYKCSNCGKLSRTVRCEYCGALGERTVIKVYKLEKNKDFIEI